MVLSCAVSEIRRVIAENYKFFLPDSHNALARGEPFEFLDELFITKTRVFGLSVSEDFVIPACVVLTQCQHVIDGQNPTVANTGL